LKPRLDNYISSNNTPRVLIYGDDKARFGAAVAALDEVRKAGIQQVSVRTDRVLPTGK
jgi:biopolymer transport protein ExbD